MSEITPVAVGDAVRVVDENYNEHYALVSAVHGSDWEHYALSINAVYISSDPQKNDPYGRQLERLSSLQHKTQVNMPSRPPGRYWENL